MTSSDKLLNLSEMIINGKHIDAKNLTIELLNEGTSPKSILDESLLKGMEVVGQRFRDQKIFVPQVLVSARAMKFAMKELEPYLIKGDYKSKGKIVIGTVFGDVHDIGKNLVSIMLQGAGYEVIDLGIGCSNEKFFDAYELHKPDIIGMSALLTTTMVNMKSVIEFFRIKNVSVPFIIGGAPVNKEFADKINADGYGKDAYQAINLCDSIIAARV